MDSRSAFNELAGGIVIRGITRIWTRVRILASGVYSVNIPLTFSHHREINDKAVSRPTSTSASSATASSTGNDGDNSDDGGEDGGGRMEAMTTTQQIFRCPRLLFTYPNLARISVNVCEIASCSNEPMILPIAGMPISRIGGPSP